MGGGGSEVSVIMTLSIPKSVWRCPLHEESIAYILQLSRYDAETRKYDKPCNDQSVEITKHVGVLCSWYQLLAGSESTLILSCQRKVLWTITPWKATYVPCQRAA